MISQSFVNYAPKYLARGGNKIDLSHFRVAINKGLAARQLILSVAVTVTSLAILLVGALYLSASPNTTKAPKQPSMNWLFGANQKPTPKPVAKPPACIEPPKTVGQNFMVCPALTLDFTKMPDGPISSEDFNIYKGAPEANHEAQFYTDSRENVGVEGGNLILHGRNDPTDGYRYTSARIDTRGKKDFQYGKIVVRATLPDQTGAWPAIWMLSSHEKYKSMSPTGDVDLADGEIDMAESSSVQPNVVYGIAHSLAHPTDGPANYFSTLLVPDNENEFHDYGLEWTPSSLTYTIDGIPYYTMQKQAGADYRSWPYDQQYYLIINLALGGSLGGQNRSQFPIDGVDASALPATMRIASIHYYPYNGAQ